MKAGDGQGRPRIIVNTRRYDPLRRCAYCGDDRPPLSDEHIIPFGIGGRLVLPNASCEACREITSGYETEFQNSTIGDLRTALRFPSRKGKGARRKSRVSLTTAEGTQIVRVAAPSAPIFLVLPLFEMPVLLTDSEWTKEAKSLVTIINPGATPALLREHGPFAPTEISLNRRTFCLMLAKIAHSFSIAHGVADIPNAKLLLPDFIRSGEVPAPYLVGGRYEVEDATDYLHEIAFGKYIASGRQFMAARIRLFAPWRSPTYFVAVAEIPVTD